MTSNEFLTSIGLETDLENAQAGMRSALASGIFTSSEEWLARFPKLSANPELALELIYSEYSLRRQRGERIHDEEWFARFPQWKDRLGRLFGLYSVIAEHDTQPKIPDPTQVESYKDTVDDSVDVPQGYEIRQELGRGGMAIVYLARQQSLNRDVAIKMLRPGTLVGPDARKRLFDEARSTAKLRHPNIVEIYEVGEREGALFIAMEFMPGGTFEEYLNSHPVPFATTTELCLFFESLSDALGSAHRAGLVHSDVKPGNILLASANDTQRPKVADFGLAIDRSGTADLSRLTLAGTPNSMAPEQTAGERATLTPATDIFALGAMLYRVLTGRTPFEGTSVADTLARVRSATPDRPRSLRPGIPPDLETVCLKCLEKSPRDRYESMADFIADLACVRQGLPIKARPVSLPERVLKWGRRKPVVAGLAIGLVVAGAIVSYLVAVNSERHAKLENAKEVQRQIEMAAWVGDRVAKARIHWNNFDLTSSRQCLDEVPNEHRREEWDTLDLGVKAFVKSTNPLVLPGSQLRTYSVSADGDELLFVPSNSSHTSCHVINPLTGRHTANFQMNSSISHAAMGRDRSVIVIPSMTSKDNFESRTKRKHDPHVKYYDFNTKSNRADFPIEYLPMTVFSPNGMHILQMGLQLKGKIYSVDRASLVSEIQLNGRVSTNNVHLHDQGRRLLHDENRRIKIYDLENPSMMWTVDALPGKKLSMVGWLADESSFLAFETEDQNPNRPIVKIDIPTGRQTAQLAHPQQDIGITAFSPDREWLAVVRKNELHLIQTATLQNRMSFPVKKVDSVSMCFSRDNRTLYVKTSATLDVWDLSKWTKK